ncbi:murein hydrolase activator EnvC family protein [Carboxylicivirga sp. N1Y90]|uniref:murein hydrolase activator EnvC family protein n=1 Tax=Carboxylicivirga fragile TaxID=3417571 RepID=UPI003D34F27E|nr:peptidoglycan DD-metalloendopeptidase family protein [Marinilabiliaceae bacterium N1Y90]
MIIRYSILFIIVMLNLLNGYGQSVSDLEKEKNAIEKSLANSNALLKKYSKEKRKSFVSIRLLDKQISDRQRLITILNDEINWLDEDIATLKMDIEHSKSELNELKKQYATLIDKSYRNRQKYNELTFFLGAGSFNEAYRKFIILKEYNKFRRNQGILIKQQTEELEQKQVLLETKLLVQTNALKKVNDENDQLLLSKTNLSRSINKLQQKESKVKKRIRANKKALKKLEDEIVRLIKESAKEPVIFSDFDKSKGKLPSPLTDGIIIRRFGEHQHPVLKYVKIHNNGIDIQTTNSNSSALCVFDGVVSRIVSIPGYNRAVLVRHGHFLTVYANLSSVSVKTGETIKMGQTIGKVYRGDGENSGVLHFELWQESKKINPELWLSK